ncbi:MAG: hypothetical protein Tsb0016_06500 [Sphingomonadales bacterium]
MTVRSDKAPRRRAKQNRAKHSIDRILAAAAERLARGGAAAVTTTALAADAGLAVGSLYQYFADRDAVLLALHRRRMAALAETLAADLAMLPADAPWTVTLDHLVDHLAAAVVEEPGFVALMRYVASRRGDQDPVMVIGPLEQPIAVALRRVLPALDEARFALVLRVSAAILAGLTDLALSQDDLKWRGGVLFELRAALKGYLARYAVPGTNAAEPVRARGSRRKR